MLFNRLNNLLLFNFSIYIRTPKQFQCKVYRLKIKILP